MVCQFYLTGIEISISSLRIFFARLRDCVLPFHYHQSLQHLGTMYCLVCYKRSLGNKNNTLELIRYPALQWFGRSLQPICVAGICLFLGVNMIFKYKVGEKVRVVNIPARFGGWANRIVVITQLAESSGKPRYWIKKDDGKSGTADEEWLMPLSKQLFLDFGD